MEKERLERIKNLKKIRKAEEEAKAKKDEKLLLDIKKGLIEMNDFFRTLTAGAEWKWIIDYTLPDLGDSDNKFDARGQMYKDGDVAFVRIYFYNYNISIKISTGETVADAEDVLKTIRKQLGYSWDRATWIFVHGGEVCDMIMDRLEEEYEKRTSCQ